MHSTFWGVKPDTVRLAATMPAASVILLSAMSWGLPVRSLGTAAGARRAEPLPQIRGATAILPDTPPDRTAQSTRGASKRWLSTAAAADRRSPAPGRPAAEDAPET